MTFKHNSWSLNFREPFGSQPLGSLIAIKCIARKVSNIQLWVQFNGATYAVPMKPLDDPIHYGCEITLPQEPGLLHYYFTFESAQTTLYYGPGATDTGGPGTISQTLRNRYQITVYKPGRNLPTWYREGIMYQIFPDRFHKGHYPDVQYFPKAVIHGRWEDSPSYFRNLDSSINFWDFFGGNLQGIIDKLDYLKSLNITILYLNPIFESHSNHKYDTSDYLRISPEFGDLETFQTLCSEAEARGIRVVLDGVFSHTGSNSRYFNKDGYYDDLGAYQSKDSPYYSWYRFDDYPDEYESWWGIDTMPNTEEHDPSYRDFICKSKDSVIRYWLRNGASGWRLDVADELPDDFIVEIKKALMAEKKDAVLIGEVWEDASNKVAYDQLRQYFWGDELDAVMNYPFREALLDFALEKASPTKVMQRLLSLCENYPPQQWFGNMNLIGSHDRTRILTILGDAPTHNLDKEDFFLNDTNYDKAKKRLIQLCAIQMSFPGVPCIYYGDEAGVQGYEDPYNRKTYPWGYEDQTLLGAFRQLTAFRNKEAVLKKGKWIPYQSDTEVLVYSRQDDGLYIHCFFNQKDADCPLGQLFNKDVNVLDPLTEQRIDANHLILKPKGYAFLKTAAPLEVGWLKPMLRDF